MRKQDAELDELAKRAGTAKVIIYDPARRTVRVVPAEQVQHTPNPEERRLGGDV